MCDSVLLVFLFINFRSSVSRAKDFFTTWWKNIWDFRLFWHPLSQENEILLSPTWNLSYQIRRSYTAWWWLLVFEDGTECKPKSICFLNSTSSLWRNDPYHSSVIIPHTNRPSGETSFIRPCMANSGSAVSRLCCFSFPNYLVSLLASSKSSSKLLRPKIGVWGLRKYCHWRDRFQSKNNFRRRTGHDHLETLRSLCKWKKLTT